MIMTMAKFPQRMYTRPRPDATAEIWRKCFKGILNLTIGSNREKWDKLWETGGGSQKQKFLLITNTNVEWIGFLISPNPFSSGRSRREGPMNVPDSFEINSISNEYQYQIKWISISNQIDFPDSFDINSISNVLWKHISRSSFTTSLTKVTKINYILVTGLQIDMYITYISWTFCQKFCSSWVGLLRSSISHSQCEERFMI